MTAADDAAAGRLGDPTSQRLHELADALAEVARRVDRGGGRPLDHLARATLDTIGGAESVSVSVLEGDGFRTEATTDDVARRADRLQYELGSGPCVDAALDSTTNRCGDVAADPRWRAWGERAFDDSGIRSVLAHRLVLEGEDTPIASLNAYSTRADAFDEQDVYRGALLATHGSLLVAALLANRAATDLAESLRESREVGVAMGVLMHRHRLTRDQAFDLLRLAGRENDLSLADVASAVVDSGGLELLGPHLTHDPDAGALGSPEPGGS